MSLSIIKNNVITSYRIRNSVENYYNDKKIFLLNPIPEEVSYKDEIKAMADVIINGDLSKIV